MDILEELDGIHVDNSPVRLCYLINEAAKEIRRLRSLVGAVTPGPSAADIMQPLRHAAPEAS